MMRLNTPLTQIDTAQAYEFGSRVQDKNCNEYIYLKGIASTVVGSWVTYDELGVTTLLAANAKGPVAIAMAITDVATEFGWYQIAGTAEGRIITGTSVDTTVGRETTDGIVGDGRAAGDEINNCMCRDANATGATIVATVQIMYPFVNDFTGA
jgi:hypothetical protein